MTASPEAPKPEWPDRYSTAQIERLDAATVGHVLALLEKSEGILQLVLREAELDALWSLAEIASHRGGPDAAAVLSLLWEAHEALGHGEREGAVRALGAAREVLVARD